MEPDFEVESEGLSSLPEFGDEGPNLPNSFGELDDDEMSPSNSIKPKQKEGPIARLEATQWTLAGPGIFAPSGPSYKTLPPGYYVAQAIGDIGHCAVIRDLVTDNLEPLAGSINTHVIEGITKFWRSKERYQKHGLSFKRGVFFYGRPGSGKTATIKLLCSELISKFGGIVFHCENVSSLIVLLHKLRKIERDTPIIVVMEDLDELISNQGEHGILALLDGEAQIDNVVFLASSNYPEKLGARIVNRPSRFDELIHVAMPSATTREAYFRILVKNGQLEATIIQQWVEDTDGFSIAHLRELFVAHVLLEQPYEEVLSRLKSMFRAPQEEAGFTNGRVGDVFLRGGSGKTRSLLLG